MKSLCSPIEETDQTLRKRALRMKKTKQKKGLSNRKCELILRAPKLQFSSTHNTNQNTCISILSCMLILILTYKTYKCITKPTWRPRKMPPVTVAPSIFAYSNTLMCSKLTLVCTLYLKVKGNTRTDKLSYAYPIVLCIWMYTDNQVHISMSIDTDSHLNVS